MRLNLAPTFEVVRNFEADQEIPQTIYVNSMWLYDLALAKVWANQTVQAFYKLRGYNHAANG